MRRDCRERLPHIRLQRTPLISDPGMHHGTCVNGFNFNIKVIFPGKAIVGRPSYLYNGNSYTGKTVSLYWNNPWYFKHTWLIVTQWRLVASQNLGHYLTPMLNSSSIGCGETKFIWIWIQIQQFVVQKVHLKISYVKCRPFCPGLNELKNGM